MVGGDPRARRLCLTPGCPTAKSAARVLFYPPSTTTLQRNKSGGCASFNLDTSSSRLCCEQRHDSLPQCAESPRSPGGSLAVNNLRVATTTVPLPALTRRLLQPPSPQSHRPRKAALRLGKHHETSPQTSRETRGGKKGAQKGNVPGWKLCCFFCSPRSVCSAESCCPLPAKEGTCSQRPPNPSVRPCIHPFSIPSSC